MVVLVPVVVCVDVLVSVVPAGGVALGLTTRSVGWTVVAGTTVVCRPEAGTGFDAVASAGVGVAWAPTGTVFDSIESGSLAGNPPIYIGDIVRRGRRLRAEGRVGPVPSRTGIMQIHTGRALEMSKAPSSHPAS